MQQAFEVAIYLDKDAEIGNLGDFTLSMDENVARETNLLFFGEENRPKNMWITITLQISNDTYFARRSFLPYELPLISP